MLTTQLRSDRSAVTTFSYCFIVQTYTCSHHNLPSDTGSTHFYEVHKHMQVYYYALLFTGSFASIVKAVTARALDHICGCAMSLATHGNARCTSQQCRAMQVHWCSRHVPLADKIALGQLY